MSYKTRGPDAGTEGEARSCKTTDDLIELARSEGAELTDDQLEAIAGGVLVCSCDGVNTCESKEICVGHGRGI